MVNVLFLFGGTSLLWWGGNWKVALGGYFLAAWMYGIHTDAWKEFAHALDAISARLRTAHEPPPQ